MAPGLDEFDVIIRSCIVFSQSTLVLSTMVKKKQVYARIDEQLYASFEHYLMIMSLHLKGSIDPWGGHHMSIT